MQMNRPDTGWSDGKRIRCSAADLEKSPAIMPLEHLKNLGRNRYTQAKHDLKMVGPYPYPLKRVQQETRTFIK
ncbi:MAG: hypothetical protein ACLSGB_13450 [Dorea sp.]